MLRFERLAQQWLFLSNLIWFSRSFFGESVAQRKEICIIRNATYSWLWIKFVLLLNMLQLWLWSETSLVCFFLLFYNIRFRSHQITSFSGLP